MSNGIDRLLNPRSVAVVGASEQEGKAGNLVVRQILKGSFRVFAVNGKGGSVFGLPAYRSVRDVPDEVDLAVIDQGLMRLQTANGDLPPIGAPVKLVGSGEGLYTFAPAE